MSVREFMQALKEAPQTGERAGDGRRTAPSSIVAPLRRRGAANPNSAGFPSCSAPTSVGQATPGSWRNLQRKDFPAFGLFMRFGFLSVRASRCLAPLLTLCFALALGGGSALAVGMEREPVRRGFAPQPGMSIDQVNRLLRGQVEGRAVSVVPVEGGRRGYKLRVLLDGGRIVSLRMDRDGRIRKPRETLLFE